MISCYVKHDIISARYRIFYFAIFHSRYNASEQTLK